MAMVGRLGNVLFWAACVIAAPIFWLAYQDWAYHIPQTLHYGMGAIFLILGVLVVLIGLAIKYVLSAR
jgi:hypothetical protein